MPRRLVALVAVVLGGLLTCLDAGARAIAPEHGAFAGTAACVTGRWTPARRDCKVIRGLLQTGGPVVVSPDGRNAYVGGDNSILEFARDRRTGGLALLPGRDGCVSATGRTPGAVGGELPGAPRRPHATGCRRWPLMIGGTEDLTVTSDGRTVLLGGFGLRAFSRDRQTGVLAPIGGPSGCLGYMEAPGCVPLLGATNTGVVRSLDSIVLTSDERNVYALGGAVLALARDQQTGGLVQLPGADGCLGEFPGCTYVAGASGFAFSSIGASADGRFVYTTTPSLIFARDETTGVLRRIGRPHVRSTVFSPSDVAISREGRVAYMADETNGLLAFRRDLSSGALIQFHTGGCYGGQQQISFDRLCQRIEGIGGPYSVIISPDDKTVYAASDVGLAALRRDVHGGLHQFRGSAGCATTLSGRPCAPTRASALPNTSVSPDGRYIYVTSNGYDNGLISIYPIR